MLKLDFMFCLIVSNFVCNHSRGDGVWKISNFSITDRSRTDCTDKFRTVLKVKKLNSSEWPNFSNFIHCPRELKGLQLNFTISGKNACITKSNKSKQIKHCSCLISQYIRCSKQTEAMKGSCSLKESSSSKCRGSMEVSYTVVYDISIDTSLETRNASPGIIDVTTPSIESATRRVVKTYTETSLMSGYETQSALSVVTDQRNPSIESATRFGLNKTHTANSSISNAYQSYQGYESHRASSGVTDETNPSIESVTRFELNKTHTANSSMSNAYQSYQDCSRLWVVVSIETTFIVFGLVGYMIKHMPRGKLHGIFTRKSPRSAEMIPMDPDARYPRNGQQVPFRLKQSKISTREVNDLKTSPPLDIKSNMAVPVAGQSQFPYIRRSALLSDPGHQGSLLLPGTQHSNKDSQQIQETQKSSNRTTSNVSKTVTAGKSSSAIKSIGFLFEKANNYQSSTIQQVTSTNLPQTLSETVKTGTANKMNSRAEKTTESQPVPIEELPINILKRIWRTKIREKI